MNLNSIAKLCCVGMLATALGGCSLFQKQGDTPLGSTSKKTWSQRMPWSKSKDAAAEPYPNPVKLAAAWTPDTLTQTGRVPTRGFGARIFFYDEKSRPVPVEGTLVVHAFDERKAGLDSEPAVKRYEFTPEQFTRHFSQSDLGASYSVWIPWDAIGGQQTRISLVASFSTAEGKTVQGTPTTVLLPGTKEGSATSLANRYAPEYRRWQAAAAGDSPPTSGLTTTTIHRSTPAPRRDTTTPEFDKAKSPAWNVANSASGNAFDVAKKPAAEKPSSALQVLPASTRTK